MNPCEKCGAPRVRGSDLCHAHGGTTPDAPDTLLPCPFCGGDYIKDFPGAVAVVQCHYCGIALPVEEWNSRPIEEQLRAKVEVLTKALERVMTGRYASKGYVGQLAESREIAEEALDTTKGEPKQ